jgi:pimeloyl-ACP methyl ester carboxylesterase
MHILRGWFWLLSLAWGLNAATTAPLKLKVFDPNPLALNEAGEVISPDSPENVDRLTATLPTRIGVMADGVSQLLLRVQTTNAITFSVSPRIGQLRALTADSANSTTVTIQPVRDTHGFSWAFALFIAPDDLPGANVRKEVVISAREPGKAGSVRLRVENPPVLLVHGLWSNSATWDGLRTYLEQKDHTICSEPECIVNYGAEQPAPSFDPRATTADDQFAVNHLIEKTANTLNTIRAEGLAVAQVDVVAHSLGGLIARARVALTDTNRAYRRKDNFQRGDFHKLITVGTPHQGTPAADFLISNRCVRSTLLGNVKLQEYMAGLGFPLDHGVEEMRTVSAALTNLGATEGVPSHAIVGLAPRNAETEQSLNSLPSAFGSFETIDTLLGGNGNHDTLVPRLSQAGGLPKSAVTLARSVVHSDVAPADVSETESSFVWRRVAQLLRAPTNSKSFGNFTALETNAVPPTPPCE